MELGLIFHGVLNTILGWTNRFPAPAPASQDIVLRDSSTPDASLIVPQARWVTNNNNQLQFIKWWSSHELWVYILIYLKCQLDLVVFYFALSCAGYWLPVLSWWYLGPISHMSGGSERDQGWMWWMSRTCWRKEEQNSGGDPEQEHCQWQESAQDHLQ